MSLLLLPNALGEDFTQLPFHLHEIVSSLDYLVAESDKSARIYLKQFGPKERRIPILLLNEHSRPLDVEDIVDRLKEGKKIGLISDQGVPCIADPGSQLVFHARKLKIPVQAIGMPSSFIRALMLSGLPGQKFAFSGYLSKDPMKRKQEVKKLEKRSKEEGSTELFMEAPYKNNHLLQSCLEVLNGDTYLCIAADLGKEESVLLYTIKEWKKIVPPELDKKPAVFLIYSA